MYQYKFYDMVNTDLITEGNTMMTIEQARKMIRQKVKAAGGVEKAAEAANICESTYLSQQLSGSRNLGKALLRWAGLREVKQPSLFEVD